MLLWASIVLIFVVGFSQYMENSAALAKKKEKRQYLHTNPDSLESRNMMYYLEWNDRLTERYFASTAVTVQSASLNGHPQVYWTLKNDCVPMVYDEEGALVSVASHAYPPVVYGTLDGDYVAAQDDEYGIVYYQYTHLTKSFWLNSCWDKKLADTITNVGTPSNLLFETLCLSWLPLSTLQDEELRKCKSKIQTELALEQPFDSLSYGEAKEALELFKLTMQKRYSQ